MNLNLHQDKKSSQLFPQKGVPPDRWYKTAMDGAKERTKKLSMKSILQKDFFSCSHFPWLDGVCIACKCVCVYVRFSIQIVWYRWKDYQPLGKAKQRSGGCVWIYRDVHTTHSHTHVHVHEKVKAMQFSVVSSDKRKHLLGGSLLNPAAPPAQKYGFVDRGHVDIVLCCSVFGLAQCWFYFHNTKHPCRYLLGSFSIFHQGWEKEHVNVSYARWLYKRSMHCCTPIPSFFQCPLPEWYHNRTFVRLATNVIMFVSPCPFPSDPICHRLTLYRSTLLNTSVPCAEE